MQHLIQRSSLVGEIAQRLRESPVTVLLGARQVGKTTLATLISGEFPDITVYDLERETGRAALTHTPELTLSRATGVVVIDEVQRMPSLFATLRP